MEINENKTKGVKQNQNKSQIKRKDNKTKSCDNVVVIDLISSEESNVSNQESDVETKVDESTEVEDEEEDQDFECLDSGPKKKSKLMATFMGSYIFDKNPIYSVCFNTYLSVGHNYFATVGSNQIRVYECITNGSIRLIDCFSDLEVTTDSNKKKEDYYTCCWSFDEKTGNPLVIAGGLRGVIRINDCTLKTFRHLSGHGGAINDLKISPYDHNLLLSSSEDYSLRLWNIKTFICVIRFGGESGHRSQVICADFFLLSDKYFVSTGMDLSIKIWSLNGKDMRDAIRQSYEYKDSDEKCFDMRCQHLPVFSTRKIHCNYIDCVQFFGKFVLSKSCANELMSSKPDLLDEENGFPENKISEDITICDVIQLKDTDYWFIKFSMDFEQTLLSVGNKIGQTFVWDMTEDNPFEFEPLVLERKKCKSIVRQTSFSRDGTTLVCVCDDSTIWRWNITRDEVNTHPNESTSVEQNERQTKRNGR